MNGASIWCEVFDMNTDCFSDIVLNSESVYKDILFFEHKNISFFLAEIITLSDCAINWSPSSTGYTKSLDPAGENAEECLPFIPKPDWNG